MKKVEDEGVKKPEKLIEAEKEVVNNILVQRLKAEEELDKFYEELESGNYFTQSYGKDSVVEIPGVLFATYVNYVRAQRQTMNTIENMLQTLTSVKDAMLVDASYMTIELMKTHKKNVDDGKTMSIEAQDVEDAKEEIKEVKKEPTKKKKAKVIKMDAEN